jgi:hypothetical protein
MTDPAIMAEIPGGQALIDWFGEVPSFHDAEMLRLDLHAQGTSVIELHAWLLTDEVDADGYLVEERNAIVTIALEDIIEVEVRDFCVPSLVFELVITKGELERLYVMHGPYFCLELDSSYGVFGRITAVGLRFDFRPGRPEGPPPARSAGRDRARPLS